MDTDDCWKEMVAEAQRQIKGNCPLLEDATILAIQDLLLEAKEALCCGNCELENYELSEQISKYIG